MIKCKNSSAVKTFHVTNQAEKNINIWIFVMESVYSNTFAQKIQNGLNNQKL